MAKEKKIDHPIGCMNCGKQIGSVELAPDQEYKGDQAYAMRCEVCQDFIDSQLELNIQNT